MSTNQSIRSLLNKFTTHLATVKTKIKIENSVNDYSLNILMETTIMKLFNIAEDLQFQNVNLFQKNYPAVDGIDQYNKIMTQVTSTFSTEKIEHTVKQIIEKNIYKDYHRLIFIVLKDKSKLTNSFKTKIEKLIDGKFQFDLDSDIVDLEDLYRIYFYKQDIQKIEHAVNILAEVLNYIPEDNISGYDAIGIIFHEDEIENAFLLVDVIIKEGINVYITSLKLFQKFKAANHPHKDLIVLIYPELSLNNITYCITVLSNSFINQLQNERRVFDDRLYNYVLENEIRVEYISFDTYLKEYKKIRTKIRSYRNMQQNLVQGVRKILGERLNASAFGNISMEEIKQEIINTHNIFKAKIKQEESDFIFLNLRMPGQLDVELNYLILSKDFVLKNVSERISKNYKAEELRNLNVLVPKDFSQKTRKRIESVKAEFKTQQVEYIDEYIFDKRFGNLKQNSILNTNEFVSPVIKSDDEFLRLNDVIHWIFNNSESSMAIINGSGGIGKTTVCQKISDIIVENNERIIVIFIEADRYIEVFGKKGSNGEPEYDIYNIFNACHPHAAHFDKNSFYLNCSLGNIVIIFDGIDEIISTIPSFNLFQFLRTLENLRARLGKEKILINCRDAYITDLNKFYSLQLSNKIQVYELLGFSEELATVFFSKHFDDENLVKQCIKLVKEFFPNEKEVIYKYPPFILEIIIQIVSSDFSYEEIDSEFNSKILLSTDRSDLVIYRICNREFIKKESRGFQLSIDQQVLFLCELAMEEKGEITRNDFVRLLQQINVEDRVEDIAIGLIDHPLIININAKYVFRFDFFDKYFKSVAIFNMIATDMPIHISDRLINVLAYDCNFNSVISKSLIKKANECTIYFEDCLKYSKILMHTVLKFEQNESLPYVYRKKKAVSNILVIILSSLHPKYSNEDIINYIFGNEKNEIKNFCFIDVPAFANIELDFSGFYFSDSEVVNYGSFFQCKFNKDTYFDETCTISKVYDQKINWKNISAELLNFDKRIKGDNSIFKIMNFKKNGNSEFSRYFKAYLATFYYLGQMKTEGVENPEIIRDDLVDIAIIRGILKENEIIIKYENGIVYLNEKFKFKVHKFITQGLPFSQLNRSISSLKSIILSGGTSQY